MAFATWSDVKDFPAYEPPYRFVYVLELSNGVVKVGRSCSPRKRFVHHMTACRVRGLRLLRIHVQPGDCESELLTRLRRIGVRLGTAREYFTGVSFGQAVTLARQMSRNGHKER
jgi:hypothetical protein